MMKKDYVIKLTARLLALAIIFYSISSVEASSFPFRGIEKGGAVPDVSLVPLKSGETEVKFSELKGAPFIVIFWGAESSAANTGAPSQSLR